MPCSRYAASSRDPRAFPPSKRTTLLAETIAEVLTESNTARMRSNPRVLKRAVRAYPPKRRKHANWPQPTRSPAEAVLVTK